MFQALIRFFFKLKHIFHSNLLTTLEYYIVLYRVF